MNELTTDKEKKDFVKEGLKDLKFLYSNMDSEDSTVWTVFSYLHIVYWAMFQQFKSLFCGPLVLHTFAAHFIMIGGAVKVASLVNGPAWSSLALASALVITYFLMCQTILTANNAQQCNTLKMFSLYLQDFCGFFH